jgi:broad specificity phosphatase PhoE
MLKMILPLAALATAACAAIPVRSEPRTIYVMRHLDTPAGVADPDLTAAGQANARRLASWFRNRKLDALHVSTAKRAQQSVAPLATAKGLTPLLYDPRDGAGLIVRVKESGGDVLVVGHSNTVPDIIEQLGGERPADIPHEQFGDVWELKGGATTRHRLDD